MFYLAFWALVAVSSVLAAPGRSPSVAKRCVNDASDRSCWGDYDLSTDYYDVDAIPDTGVTREYWFDIRNGTAAPDGVERPVLTVNGSFPGPTIIADWGDTVVVHVTNSMQNNGTGIHFHGIRQYKTNQMDGVPSITQCPIAPGDSLTYTWRATQYGSSWYHSHFYVQAWDGVFGGIIINGPATANYDEDLGSLFLSDWSHDTADAIVVQTTYSDTAAVMPTSLINGTNVWGATGAGARFETTLAPGRRYRLRLVNAAASNHFRFTIDGHVLEVMAADFVPIRPYRTTHVSVGAGERYDVVVAASASASASAPHNGTGVDAFWMRAIPQLNCTKTTNVDDVLGIVRYAGLGAGLGAGAGAGAGSNGTAAASPPLPATTAYVLPDSCADEDPADLVPWLRRDPGAAWDVRDDEVTAVDNGAEVRWTMGGSSFAVDWARPSLGRVAGAAGADSNAGSNAGWTAGQHALVLPAADRWVYLYVQTTSNQAHPIHLHGHDFWVLASGWGNYSDADPRLRVADAPRRDVAMVPGNGYLVIAFYTDNPGAWLLHCHIAWHTSEGFAMQIIERESEILPMIDTDTLNSTCANWKAYAAGNDITQWGSGV